MSKPWEGLKLATPLVDCVLRYLYNIGSSILQALKALLNALLISIDIAIMTLRAFLAQYDLLAIGEKIVWSFYEAVIEALKSQLKTVPDVAVLNQCPEIYEYFTAPAVALIEAKMEIFSIYRDRYKGLLSYMDELDGIISYWTTIKELITALIQVIDDAHQYQTERLRSAIVDKIE
jgi:hypothetical protein